MLCLAYLAFVDASKSMSVSCEVDTVVGARDQSNCIASEHIRIRPRLDPTGSCKMKAYINVVTATHETPERKKVIYLL